MTFPVKSLEENASTLSLAYSTAALVTWGPLWKTWNEYKLPTWQINAFGENVPLVNRSSGYYATPLTKVKLATNNLDRQPNSTITLTTSGTYEKSNCTIALKVHCQFAYIAPKNWLGW